MFTRENNYLLQNCWLALVVHTENINCKKQKNIRKMRQ